MDARLPRRGSKFFQFHVVLWKIWQNGMLAASPPGGMAPHPREILDPPLSLMCQLDEKLQCLCIKVSVEVFSYNRPL